MRKLFPILLVLSLLAGLTLPAAAAQMTAGQPQAVTVVDDETPAIFQFIPNRSGYYRYYSFNSPDCDPYGYITDADGDLLADGDDTGDGLDFSISCYLTAGNTYYLAATSYSGSAQYTVQIDGQSAPTAMAFDTASYTGGIREVLYPQILFAPEGSAQEEVTFTSSDYRVVTFGDFDDFYLGIPGTATITATSASGLKATCTITVEPPATLPLNTPWTFDAAKGEQYLQFIAPATGWYGISSAGDEINIWVDVLDKNLDGIVGDDDTLPKENFFAPVYLEAAQLCYFGFASSNQTGTAQVTLQKLDAATAITLPQDKLTGYVDTVCQLTPLYAPQISVPENLTWKSSDEDVVYVNDDGYVSFLAPGTADITMTSETGKSDSIAVTVLPAPTGSDLTDWGICGPNLQWTLSNTGVLTITGSGEMYDRYSNLCHWDDHVDRITQVVFPEGITGIGAYTFQDCSNLTKVDIPETVRCIGSNAFSSCYSLTRVHLPEKLDHLGGYAFDYCMSLEQINLPTNLKRIPAALFQGCSALSQITLPGTLVSIGDDAFAGCSIEQLHLPEGLKTIGNGALASTRLTALTLPEGLTELRDYALVNCYMEELTIPSSVTKLGCGFVSGNEISSLYFLGNAPEFDEYALDYLEVTAYYPAGNPTWTAEVRKNYGGTVTWVPEGNPGVTLSGTVSATGAVTLTLEETQITLTAESGSYAFPNLQPGTYTLTVSAANHVTRTYSVTVGSTDLTLDVKLHLIGDIDGNGKVNIGDVAKLYAHVKGTASLTDYALVCADISGNGKINVGDTASLYGKIRGN